MATTRKRFRDFAKYTPHPSGLFEYCIRVTNMHGELYTDARLTTTVNEILRKGREVTVRIRYAAWKVEIYTSNNKSVKYVLPIGTPDLRYCQRVTGGVVTSDDENDEDVEEASDEDVENKSAGAGSSSGGTEPESSVGGDAVLVDTEAEEEEEDLADGV